MRDEQKKDSFRHIMLSIWALITLVLFMVAALLVRELMAQGKDPFAVQPQAQVPSTADVPGQAERVARQVTLYFATPDGHRLAPEKRRIELGESTQENCRTIIEALIHGPRDYLTQVLPGTVKLNSIFLMDDGNLVIDFSREIQMELPKSAAAEALMTYAIANTLTQADVMGTDRLPVRTVQFLVGGSPPTEQFPRHIDLGSPVKPDPRWNATNMAASSGNV